MATVTSPDDSQADLMIPSPFNAPLDVLNRCWSHDRGRLVGVSLPVLDCLVLDRQNQGHQLWQRGGMLVEGYHHPG